MTSMRAFLLTFLSYLKIWHANIALYCSRFDLRPFLYPGWNWAYKKIEATIAKMGERGTTIPAGPSETTVEETRKQI